MENTFRIIDDIAIIDVPYKKTVVHITIDKEDIEIASSIQGRWIYANKGIDEKTGKTYFYVRSNKESSLYLHKLIANCDITDSVYFKDNDSTNIRKENLSVNSYDVDDAFIEKRRQAFYNMSEEAKFNFYKGMRENRYTKEWSDKISDAKKGENNPRSVLTPKIVEEIRYQYAKREVTQKSLADTYNVGRTTIADIVNYRTWNEIGENPNKKYRQYNEEQIFLLDLTNTPISKHLFNNADIPQEEFVLEVQSLNNTEFIFVQKIGSIKLYVEIRNKSKEFVSSFEVVFPEYITNQHIHNYVITHQKPLRYMNRHDIHLYMQLVSTYIYGESY